MSWYTANGFYRRHKNLAVMFNTGLIVVLLFVYVLTFEVCCGDLHGYWFQLPSPIIFFIFGPDSEFPPKPKALCAFCGTIQVVIFNNNETCLWGFGQYTDCRIKHQWNWPASRCLLHTVVGIQLKACAASLRCLWQTKHLACLSFAYSLSCVWV